MLEKETLQPPTETLPIGSVLEGLSQWQESLNKPLHVLGRGTPVSDADRFFEDGLRMQHEEKGNYGDLSSVVIGLNPGNPKVMDTLNNWPHKDHKNVLFLAVIEDGTGLDEFQHHWYFDGMIQPSGKKSLHWGEEIEEDHVLSEWILGMYNAETGQVTMNPEFTGRPVTAQDFERSTGESIGRHKALQAIIEKHGEQGLMPGFNEHEDVNQSEKVSTYVTADDIVHINEQNDEDLVW